MPAPSSRHLSHDFKAYKELTLRELFFVVVSTTFSTCVFFILIGLASGWAVAFGSAGFLIGFIVAITFLPRPISRLKLGKPHGYLMKQATVTLARLGLKKSPFLNYIGVWKKSKRVRSPHV